MDETDKTNLIYVREQLFSWGVSAAMEPPQTFLYHFQHKLYLYLNEAQVKLFVGTWHFKKDTRTLLTLNAHVCLTWLLDGI